MKDAQQQSIGDLKRRFYAQYSTGTVFDHDPDKGLYRVRDSEGIETDWCEALHHVGLQGVESIGAQALVLHPHGDDTGGIILGLLPDE